MNYKDLVSKRNKLMNDATILSRTANITAEQRSQVQTMLRDVDALEVDIETAKRVDDFEAAQRSSTRPPRSTPGEHNNANQEEKRAFRNFITSGESRDLTTTSGAALISPAFYDVLTQAQQAYGGLLNAVNVKTSDTGATMKISLVSDLNNSVQTWPEDSAATTADPTLQTATSSTEMYQTSVLVTLEELQDSFFDIDAFVRDLMMQRMYRGIAKRLSQGSSSGAFANLWAGLPAGPTSGNASTVTYSDLVALWGSVDPAYSSGPNAAWLMNSQTRALLAGLTTTTGEPIFTVGGTISGSVSDTLLGRPVILDQFAPNVGAGNTAIAFGDFKSAVTYRQVGSFSVVRDPYTYLASKGCHLFILYGRGGSFLTDAGTHPVKTLVQHAS